jgi:hypothetical protein
MSRILVIPDVHLKPWMFDQADAIPANKYDTIVCVGDLVDEWNQQNNLTLYEDTLKRVLKFDEAHPDMLWCYGNHDISYQYCLQESGFSMHMMATVNKYLDKLADVCDDRLAILQRVDNWIFSHAGLNKTWIKDHIGDADSLIIKTNRMIYSRDDVMNHLWKDNSPIWFRFQEKYGNDYARSLLYTGAGADWRSIKQCVGHTPTALPYEVKSPNGEIIALSLDTFSTTRHREPIGNERFVIIDTNMATWSYA